MILNYLDGTIQTTNTYTILNNLDTNIIPKDDLTYNLGSPDKKFNELFIGNNSIWFGDTHKISISNDKLKFKKIKNDTVPNGLITKLDGIINHIEIEQDIKTFANVTNLSDINLGQWLSYARQKNSSVKNINEIFTDADIEDETQDETIWITNNTSIYNNTSYNKIGIGTTNPTHNLHIEGDTLINGNLLINDLNIITHIENTSNNLVTLLSNNSTSIGTIITHVTANVVPNYYYIDQSPVTEYIVNPEYKTLTITYDDKRYPKIDADDGNLIAHYKFDGDFTDSSGNGYDLIVKTGTPTTSNRQYVIGLSSFFTNNSLKTTDYTLNNKAFSVAFWCYAFEPGNIITQRQADLSNQNLHIQIQTNYEYRFGFYGNDLDSAVYDDRKQWVHLVFQIDSNKNREIWRNGVRIANDISSSFLNTGASEVIIGEWPTPNNNYYGSYLDDFRIYDKALTQEEITDLYNQYNQTPYILTFDNPTECDILIVGGGGGGGESYGGGGGAGAVIFMKDVPMNGTYNIKIGKGGNVSQNIGNDGICFKGNDTEIYKSYTNKVIAEGGGAGGAFANGNGGDGGSGGGGEGYAPSYSTGTFNPSGGIANAYIPVLEGVSGVKYGNNGGSGFIQYAGTGGGGGGAGAIGESATSTNDDTAYGGVGVYKASITGTEYNFKELFNLPTDNSIGEYFAGGTYNGSTYSEGVYFGGGGGGGLWEDPDLNPSYSYGGLGGGGKSGSFEDGVLGENGLNNTGGGGGGGGGELRGGSGGSGIVIIRYKTTNTKNSVNISSLVVNQTIEQPIVDIKKNDNSVLYIDESGNVGINNNTPEKKLHIDGDTLIKGNLFINDNDLIIMNGNIGIGTDNFSQHKLHVIGNTNIDGDLNVSGGLTISGGQTTIDTNQYTTEQLFITNDGSGPALLINQNGTGNILDIKQHNNDILFIKDGGNIGIGTTSPTTPLQVGIGTTVSDANNKSSVCILSEQKPNEELIALSLVNYNITNPPTSFGSACSIGFHVNKDWSPTAKIMAINTDINIDSTTTDYYKRYTDLVFYTFYGELSESMRITCQGDVGIGIDTPVSKLDVDGNLNIRGDINFTGIINKNNIPIALSTEITAPAINNNNKVSANIGIHNTDYAFLDLRTNNNLGGWIDFSSIVGEDFSTRIRGHNDPVKLEFYASSTPDMILNSNGDLNVKGNITAYYSDERLKTKIEDIDNVLDKIKNISVFKYKPNAIATKYGFSNKQEIGLSAQQISYFYPELVSLAPFDREYDNETKMDKSKSGENYLTLNYERLVPILIQGIKELTKENDFLKNEIINIKKIINNKN